jgi:hypothetical protein
MPTAMICPSGHEDPLAVLGDGSHGSKSHEAVAFS